MLAQYAKAIAAIIAAALAVLVTAVTDNLITPLEAVTVAVQIGAAIGVYLVPNLPAGWRRYAKGVVAFAGAGLAALLVVLTGANAWADVTLSDWITVVLAALGGIGVVVVPNLQLDDLSNPASVPRYLLTE